MAAELRIFHSRQPSATRRVSPEPVDAWGARPQDASLFLSAVVLGAHAPLLDQADLEGAHDLAEALGRGRVPPRALRHRIQQDRQGLDVSVHHLRTTESGWAVTVDTHGPEAPQVIGSLMACASRGRALRRRGLQTARILIERSSELHGATMEDLRREVGTLLFDGAAAKICGDGYEWATRTLGLDTAGGRRLVDADVQRAYRSAVRAVHPDHGADDHGAAERLMALQRARALLLSPR